VFHNGAPSGLIVKNGTIIRYGDDYPASWSEPYHLPSDPFDDWNGTDKGKKGIAKYQLEPSSSANARAAAAPFAYEAIDAPWQEFLDGNSTLFATDWYCACMEPSRPRPD
jgi:hypothetical protein